MKKNSKLSDKRWTEFIKLSVSNLILRNYDPNFLFNKSIFFLINCKSKTFILKSIDQDKVINLKFNLFILRQQKLVIILQQDSFVMNLTILKANC